MTGNPAFDELVAWMLGSLRLLALFVAAPFFGHETLPTRVRLGFALLVTLVVAPDVGALSADLGVIGSAGIALREVLLGLALGFPIRVLFASFDIFGEFASVQGGLGAATVVDPSSGASSVALATLFQTVGLLAFLAIGGPEAVLQAAARSYDVVPLAPTALEPGAFLGAVQTGSAMFEIAVRLAAPITAAMVVANLAVGILGRLIPQLNLMLVQLPANVALVLSLLMLGAGVWIQALAGHLETIPELLAKTLAGSV